LGQNSQTTAQSQQQQTNPWAPSIPGLNNLIGQINSLGTGLTPQQSAALQGVMSATGQIPNMGPQGAQTVNNLFSSQNGMPQAGLWNQSLQNYGSTLAPYLSGNYTNPYNTPGFSTALQQANSNITNQVNGMFAGAGRSGAGSAAGSGASNASNPNFLSYSLAGAEAPIIQSQYNQNVAQQQGAAGALYGAGAGTATGTAQLQQMPFMNQIAAMQAAGSLPGLYTGAPSAQLGAATQAYQAPYQNIATSEGAQIPIAGLGGQGYSSGTSTTTQPVNPWTTALGAGLALASLGTSGGGTLGGTLLTASDENAKENIEPIGLLHNGLNVYKYNFKGDARPQIGLIAQEVEKTKPEAVIDVPISGIWGPSIKMVNYGLATAA
jgi:Chaperone of endosialidase